MTTPTIRPQGDGSPTGLVTHPRVAVVELPPEVQYDEVSSRCRPEDHAAFLLVRPGARTSAALFRDLISATGADLLRFSIGKSLADARRIAIARLKARGTRTIVVGMAEHLGMEELGDLLSVAQQTDVRLVLLHGYDEIDGLFPALDTLRGVDAPSWASFLKRLPQPVVTDYQVKARPGTQYSAAVPWQDFPLWRATARAVLTPEDFAIVDESYCRAYRVSRDLGATTSETTGETLRAQLRGARNPAEALTVARAMQAEMLTRGFLLRVDETALNLLTLEQRHRDLTADEWDRLWAIAEPWHAVATALFAAGLGQQIPGLAVRHARRNGTVSGLEVPQPAQPLVAVLAHQHRLSQSAPDEPLIGFSARTVTLAATEAAVALDLPIYPNLLSDSRRADRWQYQLGLSLSVFAS